MTILAVTQQVAPVIALAVPTLVYGGTTREQIELASLANEMARRITAEHDWQVFKTLATFTGDAATTAFNLPADWGWLPEDSDLWRSDLAAPLRQLRSANEYLGMTVLNMSLLQNVWIMLGGQVHISPAMATGVTAKTYYQSNLIVDPASGSNKTSFTADDDVFRLAPFGDSNGLTDGERLLKLGMIWQWKANKGAPYAEDMANYEDLKGQLITRDRGPTMIRVGRPTFARDVDLAYPQALSGS